MEGACRAPDMRHGIRGLGGAGWSGWLVKGNSAVTFIWRRSCGLLVSVTQDAGAGKENDDVCVGKRSIEPDEQIRLRIEVVLGQGDVLRARILAVFPPAKILE